MTESPEPGPATEPIEPAPAAATRFPPPEPTPAPAGPPPGMVEIVSRGIDLDVALSAEIRRLSIFVGGLFLAALGPISLAVIVESIRNGGFDWLFPSLDQIQAGSIDTIGLGPLGSLSLLLAVASIVAISVDIQLMATALLGAHVGGMRLDLHQTVAWARHGFWRLVFASIAVGLMLIIPRQILAGFLAGRSPAASSLVATIVDVLLSAPFAYVGAAVVLAGAGPSQAIRLSWRMARRRWRLALVVGIVNTAVSYLAGFAIGAGLDILGRIAIALGIDQQLGPLQTIELILIVGFAIVAIGSLTLTIATLSTAPQVIAWARLGGPLAPPVRPGVDPPWAPHVPARLVSIPMQLAMLASAALAFVSATGRT